MNKRLLILSGFAIIAVVANHSSQVGFLAMIWWADQFNPVMVPNYDQIGSLSYYLLVAEQKLALFSVPSFLFISGIFISYASRGSQSRLSWNVVRNRVFSLIPPYLIWTTVYYLSEFIIGNQQSISEYVMGIITIGNSPYFFVPLLIAYYLISPFLINLAKNHWKILLGFAALLLFAAIARSYLTLYVAITGMQGLSFTPYLAFLSTQFVEYFFYYAFGLVAGFQLAELKSSLFRIRWILLAAVIFFGVLAVLEAEWVYQTIEMVSWRSRTLTLPTALYAISFILCFLAFDQTPIPFSTQLYRIGAATLGIYLMHMSILIFIPKIIYNLIPGVMEYQFIFQPILIAASVGIPLLVMELTRRSPLRRYYRVLFG